MKRCELKKTLISFLNHVPSNGHRARWLLLLHRITAGRKKTFHARFPVRLTSFLGFILHDTRKRKLLNQSDSSAIERGSHKCASTKEDEDEKEEKGSKWEPWRVPKLDITYYYYYNYTTPTLISTVSYPVLMQRRKKWWNRIKLPSGEKEKKKLWMPVRSSKPSPFCPYYVLCQKSKFSTRALR